MKLVKSQIFIILIVLLFSSLSYSIKAAKNFKQDIINHSDQKKEYYISKGFCCTITYKEWIGVAYFHGRSSDICRLTVEQIKDTMRLNDPKIIEKYNLVQIDYITYQSQNLCAAFKDNILHKIKKMAYHNVYYGRDYFSPNFLTLAQKLETKYKKKLEDAKHYMKRIDLNKD